MAAKRKKKAHEEEHENTERWLLTYADMVTLLMVLFIVMFAISQVDQKKFAALSGGLSKSFGAPVTILDGGHGVLSDTGIAPAAVDIAPISSAVRPTDGPKSAQTPETPQSATPPKTPQTSTKLSPSQVAELQKKAQAEASRLDAVRHDIEKALAKAGLTGQVRFRVDQRGLVVSIVTDQVLFPADYATLSPAGKKVLDTVSPALRLTKNMLSVEGHTNTVKVKPRYFPTEWELSSARAVTVLRYLVDNDRIDPSRVSAAGFADQHPLVPPSDPRANVLNRRVEIVVLSALTGDAASFLESAAAATDTPTTTN